ncbi:carbonic anhydrase [Sediminibacterium sp.]|mgnify:CR=1 FL=1|uniref:carbonic anhydrase n=1 Tax=Sediminibacterium sp. TaxID=1917865 RepID=UPI0025D78373|nr:carbonic anhydrase [Sediminibacterium sp.]MBT9484711.1 carbonic anhydrase [Sediminibacterium sp.]
MHFFPAHKYLPLKLILLALLTNILFACNQQVVKYENELDKLMKGNQRFASLRPTHPNEDQKHMLEESKAQHPFAVVVCCSDSRVAPELIFDQGIGDLFVIRTAGNLIGGLELGSIEYAVEHFKCKLIVVLGHENCGAIKSFIDHDEAPGHIKEIIDSITKEAEIKAISINDKDRLDHSVIANTIHVSKQISSQSPIIKEKINNKQLQVVASRYDLNDFKVNVLKY